MVKKARVVRKAVRKAGERSPKVVKKTKAVGSSAAPKERRTNRAQMKHADHPQEPQMLEQQLAQREDELAILNSVGEAMAKTLDVKTVVKIVGDKVRDIFHAEAVSIMLLNTQTDMIHVHYEYDEGEGGYVDYLEPFPLGKGLTSKAIKSRQSLLLGTVEEQVANGGYIPPEALAKTSGVQSESTMFVPIVVNEKVLGVVNVANYKKYAFNENDLRLLQTLSSNMGVAIENARLFEAEQERAAELAIINSVQVGLASKLDFQSIVDSVGDKLTEIFSGENVAIGFLDKASRMIKAPYIFENGKRIGNVEFPLGERGLQAHIAKTLRPLVINTNFDEHAEEYGVVRVSDEPSPKSWLGVPIILNGEYIGGFALQNWKRENAYSDSHVRLLETLAGSLGVALENARLFKAEQERVAELAIINSVQEGLASKLDMEEIYNLVGDKIREIFNADTTSIFSYDREKQSVYAHYYVERDQPLPPLEVPFGQGLYTRIIKSRQPLLFGTQQDWLNVGATLINSPGQDRELNESYLGLPIMLGNEVTGVVSVMSYKKNAYGENDIRLLTTLSNAMSVALQNAQSFKAEQERVAELQIINSIQQGLAAELDFQAIVDLVGDKLREVFNTPELGITWYDEKVNLVHYLYIYEHGTRLTIPSAPPNPGGVYEREMKTRQPLVFNNAADYEKVNMPLIPGTDRSKSSVIVPIISSDRFLGDISIDNYERENAFGESELRLLTTVSASLGTALENARLFDETQRLFKAEQERVAELQIINSIQQGLAAELDFQSIVDLVGDKLREVFKTKDFGIRWYDEKTNLVHFMYEYEHGTRLVIPSRTLEQAVSIRLLKETRQPVVANTAELGARIGGAPLPGTDMSKSIIIVPIISSDRLIGSLQMEDYEHENAYGESELRLLTTIAASLGTALENARLFDETQRLFKAEQDRVAELQIINSIQQGLAAELDFQAIVDLVGDKLREVFNTPDLVITWYDEKNNLVHYLYVYEHGKRLENLAQPPAPGGIFEVLTRTRKPVVWNTQAEHVGGVVAGTDLSKSLVSVPIISGDRVLGSVRLENFERENAYGESELRLLTTIAASLGTALENARLFDETQRLLKITEERNAELAIINSVQAALAAELNIHDIYRAVGDKLREIFHNTDVGIRIYDPQTNLVHYPYEYENGQYITIDSSPLSEKGFGPHVIRTRETLVINENMAREVEKYGSFLLSGSQHMDKSLVMVPLVVGDQARGLIHLSNIYHEHAFSESDVRLLQTLANSMSVALENARLFDETQRLLKITEERAEELAIINSVQAGLASQLNIQAIFDLVGDKIRDTFDAQAASIITYDRQTNLVHYPYIIEKGARQFEDPRPLTTKGFGPKVMRMRQPLMINENMSERATEVGSFVIGGGEAAKSGIWVPLVIGDEARGWISIQNIDREHAFGESDFRLLTTLASSLSVAFENARLFDETQRLLKITEDRAAELAIINSVQEGLASKLDFASIIDLVGDKVREIFNSNDMSIALYDGTANLVAMPYFYEGGKRFQIETVALGKGFTAHIIETRKPLMINDDEARIHRELGGNVIGDADANTDLDEQSYLGVPILKGDQALGVIALYAHHRHAFTESHLNLLTTMTSAMSVALENARLFDETQRLLKITEDRAAELAIINSVQAALAAELNIQGIYDAIGDKIREIFHQADVGIRIYDPQANLIHFPYGYENGQRIATGQSMPMSDKGFSAHVFRTRETLVIQENMAQAMEKYGSFVIPGSEMEKSAVYVPLVAGDQARGLISLADIHREHAFSESDVRLLQTLANSMSVALENARLFDETQRLLKETEQRAAELAIINSVQEGLASKLDMQAIYDLVGDKIRDMFNAQSVIISSFDHEKKLARLDYAYEDNARVYDEELLPFSTMNKHLIATRQPVVINENSVEATKQYGLTTIEGTRAPKSLIYVPFGTGTQVNGYFSLQNMDRENAFAESDVRLLQTLAGSMGIALENARLFNAEQQRAAELAVINSIQQGLAAELDFQTIIDLVGDKLREVLNTGEIGIRWFDAEANIVHYLYEYEHNERILIPSAPLRGKTWEKLVATRKPIIMNSVAEMMELGVTAVPGTDQSKSSVYVPIVGSDRVLGVIVTEDYEKENAYTDADIRLLSTVASSMGVALENARLFNETQQRNAELAIINSVQQGLASKLEFQSIIDLIGDKVTEIFNAQATLISLYNPEKAEIDHKYLIERGERIYFNKFVAIDKFRQHVIDTRQPWLINQNYKQIAQEMGEAPVLEGEEPRSLLFVPMIVGTKVTGVISLQNLDVENAFSESDVRLLSTIASSMSVALENARLFQAEQKRVAELAAINSVGQILTEELDLNVMVERVGDKLHKALNVKNIGIGIYDEKENVMQVPYVCRDGMRRTVEPFALNAFNRRVSKAGRSLVVDKDAQRHWHKLGGISAGDEIPKSFVMVPLMAGRELVGGISLQDFENENAFADLSIGLLETVASNMGTAILNVRLFDETERLLKETEQRVSELAIINSVQQGLASKLDMQAIYDLVGNKICEIFSEHTCYIMLYDREKGLEHYPFLVDSGQRVTQEDLPHDENGFGPLVMKTLQPIMINEDMEARSREVGSYDLTEDRTEIKSAIYIPLLIGSEARGVISVQNAQRENAFSDSDLRLLTTLASSMSVALESARLFVETEQRAAELATINSIQEGLASKLEPQAIYDLVGEKLREVFGAQFLYIAIHDRETNLIHFPYFWERDHREITEEPIRYGEGLTSRVIETHQPIVINTDWLRRATELGGIFLDGELPKSSMSVPIMSGNTAIGVISLQSTVAENQYSESEVRLLSTIASSVGVALEGARLFEETEQRAAELAIINGVQVGLASKLEVQAIYELIGEKLRDLFGNMAISLVTFDLKKDIHHYEYIVEKGQRLEVEDSPITLTGRHLIRTRQTLLVNDHIVENLAQIGITMQIIPGTETPQSILRVPILIGDQVHGFIGLSDLDRENAFSPSDVRLLQTLAGSLSVALENARLFEETNRNAAELATVNTVSSALASELDVDPLIQLVGEQTRTIFGADIVYVALLDEVSNTINFPYTFGEDLPPMNYGEGLTSKIIQTGKPLLLNQDVDKKVVELGATSVGVSSQSYLGVPIFVGGRAVGVLSVQSLSRQGVFDENSQRLLTTIASNVGSALQNARLYREAQESRAAAEQANKAKSAFLANMSHELRTPLNAIIGFTRIVRRKAEGALPDKQTDNLDKVLSSAEHLLNLINTVLDIAKIEAGRMEVQASNFNISALADQCANTATPLLKPSVHLEKDIDPALTIVHSDQDKIKQIVLNLLSNAAKFTHEGKIALRIRRIEPNLVVDVTDSGIGISEEALGRIFDEFQQADTSTTRQYGGTGLGLAISRNLARLLGGDLTATSEVGKGSTFTLTIPMQYGFRSASASKPEAESTPRAAHLLRADASKKLILVIDDDPDAVYLLQENLNPEEFEVIGTRNGLEGQQMARDLKPQAILLDIIMPDKDGWQVLHDLKADEGTKDIPVILLTIVDKKALGFQLGASAYLLKPLDPAAVLDALKQVTSYAGNGHIHVLVVDDDPHVADMLRQTLPESTFQLDSAVDGVAGLQAIETHRPDVVLLDIMMPRLDGFGVIERLRADEATRDLPIIVISAKELTDDEMKTLEERVNFVMKKQGFDGEKLMQEINNVLKK